MPAARERKPPPGDRLRKQRETNTADAAALDEQTAPPSSVGRLPAHGSLRELQQTLGNARLARLLTAPPGNATRVTALQRQDTAVGDAPAAAEADAAPLLNAAQIADARRYYTSQPARYTPEIISQLRTSLGLAPDGGVDEALVLAVARFQSTDGAGDPALAIDGKAGPRTLPRIFRGGLNVEATGQAFGEDVQSQVIDQWATLATAEARRDKLVELVNERLTAAGVPAVTTEFDANENNAGSFNFPTWTMRIGRRRLGAESINEADARDTADTVYHEARHTEQWFRMAQLRASQGLTADAIARELGIQPRIATAAAAAPLTPGSMQALIAQGWWDSVYGAGGDQRNAVLREVNAAATARTAAQAAHTANPTPETQAALDQANARFDRAFAAYQNLPEENDAWATGPLAAAGVTSGSPEPEPAPGAAGLPGAAGEPAGTPPAADGPAHGTMPEENLPAGGAP
ncbi:MAG TPA: hypothetical protein VI876_09440 [Dehalococcoidia bacterium]|nr:hypothetical protein [Dehalococcoidia bacterium]